MKKVNWFKELEPYNNNLNVDELSSIRQRCVPLSDNTFEMVRLRRYPDKSYSGFIILGLTLNYSSFLIDYYGCEEQKLTDLRWGIYHNLFFDDKYAYTPILLGYEDNNNNRLCHLAVIFYPSIRTDKPTDWDSFYNHMWLLSTYMDSSGPYFNCNALMVDDDGKASYVNLETDELTEVNTDYKCDGQNLFTLIKNWQDYLFKEDGLDYSLKEVYYFPQPNSGFGSAMPRHYSGESFAFGMNKGNRLLEGYPYTDTSKIKTLYYKVRTGSHLEFIFKKRLKHYKSGYITLYEKPIPDEDTIAIIEVTIPDNRKLYDAREIWWDEDGNEIDSSVNHYDESNPPYLYSGHINKMYLKLYKEI